MALTQALQDERKRLLSELQKVDRAIAMFGGDSGTGKVSVLRKPAKRSPEASAVSRAAQHLRWSRQRKEGKTAIAKAETELKAAQKALAASKK